MSAGFIYSAVTLLAWLGWILIGKAVFGIFKLKLARSEPAHANALRSSLVSGGLGAVLALGGSSLTSKLEPSNGYQLPLVWVYTSIGGWMLIAGIVSLLVQLTNLFLTATQPDKVTRIRNVAISTVCAAIGWLWMAKAGQQVWILRGSIPFNWQTLGSFIILATVAIAVMVKTESATRQRGLAKKAVTHLTLVVGSIVFGIPFLWLLSTSFKEERDLASANGVVWIPQTQLTHPYIDPSLPLFQTTFEGRVVKAKINQPQSADKLLMEIERPYGLRGRRFETDRSNLKEIPRYQQIWTTDSRDETVTGFTITELDSGGKLIEILQPSHRKGERIEAGSQDIQPVRKTGLRWENYTESLEWMPFETYYGLRYLVNSLWLAIASIIGTVLSCSLVAYGFSRLRFPGRNALFGLMLATMMLPAAVTMVPQFLIFRSLGWVDTLMPLWVPLFFGSAFNVFLLRQFFITVPMELEEAARIDGCGYLRTYWQVMMPQVKPALAVISIWTFMSAWNNFLGPLIYVSSPEKMPLAYALHLFSGDRGSEPNLMMAFATMTVVPVVILFFSAQKYFIESVALTGMGGK